MIKYLLALLCCLAPLPVLAQSNAAPSLHVALRPCLLFADVLDASVTEGIATASLCGIPDNATAVDLSVTVHSLTAGSLKLWEYDGSEPSVPVMHYGVGTTSSFGSPRTCTPYPECFRNISAEATTDAGLVLVAVGYYVPAEQL